MDEMLCPEGALALLSSLIEHQKKCQGFRCDPGRLGDNGQSLSNL
jgi:hypothetical protein